MIVFVQALVEKYKITCTEQDMIDFCMFSDASIKSETDAKEVIQQYGLPYITQRTLEWKLMYVLAGEAEIVEGLAEDIQAECPYCGEIIPLEFKDGEFSDFECTKCHNLIEMEMMLDDHHCDCGCDCEDDEEFDCCDGDCGHCGGHHDLED